MKFGNSMSMLLLTAIFMLTTQLGCSNKPDLRGVYDVNIKKLHVCYTLYLEKHDFRGPKTEEELKEYLKTDPTAIFLMKKIDLTPEGVDDIFIGERDKEPFIVRYGLKGVADHAIVFEATGFEGKRLVALTDPVECDEETYEGYLSGKIKPDSAPGGMDSYDSGVEE